MTYDEIIENLRDHLELLNYAGVTEIPALPGSRTSQVPTQTLPDGWTFIEDPGPRFSVTSLTGPDKRVFAFGVWHAGSKLCFISGEALAGGEVELFTGPTRNQMALLVNWMAGELKLPAFDSMTRHTCYASAPSDIKNTEETHAKLGVRLIKELEKNRLSIVALLGKEACGALLGSTDVDRLRGRFHESGDLLIMPTWGPDDLLKNAELKKQTMADMLMVISETRKARGQAP